MLQGLAVHWSQHARIDSNRNAMIFCLQHCEAALTGLAQVALTVERKKQGAGRGGGGGGGGGGGVGWECTLLCVMTGVSILQKQPGTAHCTDAGTFAVAADHCCALVDRFWVQEGERNQPVFSLHLDTHQKVHMVPPKAIKLLAELVPYVYCIP